MPKKKQDTSALKAVVTRLGKEPELLQAYMKCPEAVLLGAKVPSDQVKTIVSGNQNDIKRLLDSEHTPVVVIHTQNC